GEVSVDPVSMAIQALAEFAMGIENVQKVLNPFSTILEGASILLQPLINDLLQPIVTLLYEVGEVVGSVLSPFLSLFATNIRIVVGLLNIIKEPIDMVGRAFLWLNDHVIVPAGNFVIELLNTMIAAINWALGWLGVSISYIDKLKTSTDLMDGINRQLEAIDDQMQAVRDMFDDRRKDLDDAYQKNVTSLKNLLELGAISENDYAQRMSQTNKQYESAVDALEAEEKQQLDVLQEIRDRLNSGINVYQQSGSAPEVTTMWDEAAKTAKSWGSDVPVLGHVAGYAVGAAKGLIKGIGKIFGFAEGAVEIPFDQIAVVHKGETIVPKTFAAGLRSGELTLGKGSASSPIVYQTTVNVTVQGSVQAENNLADTIARTINKRERRGMLELESV
ncbi:MAG TPA: hypothetical protein PLG43_11920, partial [Spirochaetia bacterium]|nr:hypothetical protein [Spirochaetia bacterium]